MKQLKHFVRSYACEASIVPLCPITVCKQGQEFNKYIKYVYFYHNFVNISGFFLNKTMKSQLKPFRQQANLLYMRYFLSKKKKKEKSVSVCDCLQPWA